MKHHFLVIVMMVSSSIIYAQSPAGYWPPNPGRYNYFGAVGLDHNIVGNYALIQERPNSGGTPGATFLNSPYYIGFRINNEEKMSLLNNGNFGIGKSPSYKLDVNGTINATNYLINGVPLNTGGNCLWSGGTSGSISYSYGDVGIGTATPNAPLHVKGSGFGSHIIIETNSTGEGDLRWYQGGTSGASERAAFQLSSTEGSFQGYVYDNGWYNWLHVDRFTRYVGIGTTTPASALDVNGIISSKSGGIKFPDGTIQKTAATIWTPVEAFGAVGDGMTDDRVAIQAAINSKTSVCLTPGKAYFVNGTLTMGNSGSWEHEHSLFMPATTTLLCNVYGGVAIALMNHAHLFGDGKIQMNSLSWGHNSVGIMINGSNNKIDVGTIEGFDFGIYFNGDGNSVGYNNVNVRFLHNNKYSIFMKVDNAPLGWVNQNYIHFDRIRVGDGAYPSSDAIGIYMNPTKSLPNMNTFSGCIEEVNIGLYLIGAYNRFEGLRLENCTKKVYLADSPDGELTRNNYFYGDFGEFGSLLNVFDSHLTSANSIYNAVSVFGWDDWTSMHQAIAAQYWSHSDERFKKDIKKLEGALDKVLALKGTTYKMVANDNGEKKKGEQKKEYGFIAQELKEVLPELVMQNPFDGKYAVNYIGVIPFLVEAIKEQQKQIDRLQKMPKMAADSALKRNPMDSSLVKSIEEQQATIDSLQAKINTLDSSLVEASKEQQKKIENLEAKINSIDLNDLMSQVERCCSKNENNNKNSSSGFGKLTNNNSDTTTNIDAVLEQNQPNPFSGITEIRYFIPESTNTSILINIYNLNGSQIKSYPIIGKGYGSLKIDGAALIPGMYIYNLIINGEEIDSKKMILTD